jgi:hypothetical protein
MTSSNELVVMRCAPEGQPLNVPLVEKHKVFVPLKTSSGSLTEIVTSSAATLRPPSLTSRRTV